MIFLFIIPIWSLMGYKFEIGAGKQTKRWEIYSTSLSVAQFVRKDSGHYSGYRLASQLRLALSIKATFPPTCRVLISPLEWIIFWFKSPFSDKFLIQIPFECSYLFVLVLPILCIEFWSCISPNLVFLKLIECCYLLGFGRS